MCNNVTNLVVSVPKDAWQCPRFLAVKSICPRGVVILVWSILLLSFVAMGCEEVSTNESQQTNNVGIGRAEEEDTNRPITIMEALQKNDYIFEPTTRIFDYNKYKALCGKKDMFAVLLPQCDNTEVIALHWIELILPFSSGQTIILGPKKVITAGDISIWCLLDEIAWRVSTPPNAMCRLSPIISVEMA